MRCSSDRGRAHFVGMSRTLRYLVVIFIVSMSIPSSAWPLTITAPADGALIKGPKPSLTWSLAGGDEVGDIAFASNPTVDSAGDFLSENREVLSGYFYDSDGVRYACCDNELAVRWSVAPDADPVTAGAYWWQVRYYSSTPQPDDPGHQNRVVTEPRRFVVVPYASGTPRIDCEDYEVPCHSYSFRVRRGVHNLPAPPRVRWTVIANHKVKFNKLATWDGSSSTFRFERVGLRLGQIAILRLDVLLPNGKVLFRRDRTINLGKSCC